MSDYDNTIIRPATAQEAEPEDYTGEDGLFILRELPPAQRSILPRGQGRFRT